MPFQKYIDDISKRYATGTAREHTYRPSLQSLLEDVIPGIMASNDPARIECGAPDFILSRRNINVGYIEVKDIGDDLTKTEKSEQLKRYRDSLDNLILTDYLEFRFFIYGNKVETIRIGEIHGKSIKPIPENFDRLKALLIDFAAFQGQTIKSAKELAVMMAHKARLMRDVFFKAVQDESENNTLYEQLQAFRTILVHDMDAAQFADVYAQTITYGLFTARLHDESLDNFTRAEAFTLIPKSNPFLQQLFHYVAGPDLDNRVIWIVDALCEVYRATDLRAILKDFGTATGQNDPILHFYETFLAEYDPKLRKSRGVFYTPEPVVNFIVRAIDDVLKTHFGLSDGVANTSKVEIEVDTDIVMEGKRQREKKTVHKVQMLDVATGTGTFLAEVVKQIYSRFKGQEGLWSSYVENDLLPRLHGFELLMASYAMCHMKLDLLLQETGYHPSNPHNPPRVSVYLTNSLEEHHPEVETRFASWLSREANVASRIKKDMPIMVALGNPPYRGISQNMNSWVAKHKIEDYKYVDGVHFNERKHWLNDDYVQFIRLGEHYIEKNGEGILAYITNHGYLDNPTFRGMRWHILNTFDDIYILDLHGNTNKKEVAPDGKPDKNVFDIQQGVSIIVAVKRPPKDKKKSLATIYHTELWGSREHKYGILQSGSLKTLPYKKLDSREPFFFFIPQNYDDSAEYQAGMPLDKLFPINVTGIVTARDGLVIDYTHEELIKKIESFTNPEKTDNQVRQEFFGNKKSGKYPAGDTRGWKLETARKEISGFNHSEKIQNICYRPFDDRLIYYAPEMVDWGREDVMQNFLAGNNIGLISMRHYAYHVPDYCYSFVSRGLIDNRTFVSNKGICLSYPLWIYEGGLEGVANKRPNLDNELYKNVQKIIPDITPETLFDYIYATLHSPAYRYRYAEFLKSDFPRIPYPKDQMTFNALAEKGAVLRELHLMESPALDTLITTYSVDGSHEVKKPRFEKGGKTGAGKVWINETQYFGGVPEVAWNFYIGGYQPAQKWLKDRRGRKLTIEDIRHWQRIIVALVETDRIMKGIDKIDFLPNTVI